MEDNIQSDYPVGDYDSWHQQLSDSTSSIMASWDEPSLRPEDFPNIFRDTPMHQDIEPKIIVWFQQPDEDTDLLQDVAQQATKERPERGDWELVFLTSKDMVD